MFLKSFPRIKGSEEVSDHDNNLLRARVPPGTLSCGTVLGNRPEGRGGPWTIRIRPHDSLAPPLLHMFVCSIVDLTVIVPLPGRTGAVQRVISVLVPHHRRSRAVQRVLADRRQLAIRAAPQRPPHKRLLLVATPRDPAGRIRADPQ
jgi:hypothetical protein